MRPTVLSLNSIVLLCLCADFIESDIQPLTNHQFNQLEFKLAHSTYKQPSGLIDSDLNEMQVQLVLTKEEAKQIQERLKLISEVILKLAFYERKGISIITKLENDYPDVLFARLKKHAPLYLFYTGEFDLLNDPIVSVAGPMNCNDQILENTKLVVDKIYEEGYHLMTSESKGCESSATLHHLKQGGQAIVFVASHLDLKRIEYSKYLKNKQMLLISHRYPECDYDVVEAIIRNSLIYALSQTSFIIHSEVNTGSLWFSAMQNLKQRWSKILAVVDDDFYSNARLVEAGAIPVTIEKIKSKCTIEEMTDVSKQMFEDSLDNEQISIFDFIEEDEGLDFETIEL